MANTKTKQKFFELVSIHTTCFGEDTVVDRMDTNYTPSVMVIVHREQMHNLDLKIKDLKMQMESMQEKFIKELIAMGWKRFNYLSQYYGSHRELGECNDKVTYFFHPSVNFSVWSDVEFSHGYFSQSETNVEFKKWLSELPEDHYIEMTTT